MVDVAVLVGLEVIAVKKLDNGGVAFLFDDGLIFVASEEDGYSLVRAENWETVFDSLS